MILSSLVGLLDDALVRGRPSVDDTGPKFKAGTVCCPSLSFGREVFTVEVSGEIVMVLLELSPFRELLGDETVAGGRLSCSLARTLIRIWPITFNPGKFPVLHKRELSLIPHPQNLFVVLS